MWSIDASLVLILIPILFAGIIVVAIIGAVDEESRGDKLAKFFSIASNAAIFFTVLALLYQVVDSEAESQRSSYADVLDTYYEIMQMRTENPDVWSIMYPGEATLSLDEEDQLAFQYTYFMMMFFERLYLLHLDGDIDDQQWKSWESWIRYSLTTSSLFQQIWDESCGMYHVDFISFVEANYDDGVCAVESGPAGDAVSSPAAVRPS